MVFPTMRKDALLSKWNDVYIVRRNSKQRRTRNLHRRLTIPTNEKELVSVCKCRVCRGADVIFIRLSQATKDDRFERDLIHSL